MAWSDLERYKDNFVCFIRVDFLRKPVDPTTKIVD